MSRVLNEVNGDDANGNLIHAFSASSVDVTDAGQVQAAVDDCVAKSGGIDVADSNAGFLGP